jgi:hypothetical protein
MRWRPPWSAPPTASRSADRQILPLDSERKGSVLKRYRKFNSFFGTAGGTPLALSRTSEP